MLFQERIVRTKFNIHVFIFISAHDTLPEDTSSGMLKTKRLESQIILHLSPMFIQSWNLLNIIGVFDKSWYYACEKKV